MHMETGTTRRNFLVGTGVALGTAVGAVALGGCSSKDAFSWKRATVRSAAAIALSRAA